MGGGELEKSQWKKAAMVYAQKLFLLAVAEKQYTK